MKDMTPEEQARVNIDWLLEQAGWDVQDADSINLYASNWVEVSSKQTTGRCGS